MCAADSISSLPRKQVSVRRIPGHVGYAASRDGRIWTCWTRGWQSSPTGRWKVLAPSEKPNGYMKVGLRGITRHVHALILLTFIGPPPDGLECRHKDGDKKNNSLDNLHYGTKKQNQADRTKHHTSQHGERNPTANFTNEQAAVLRELRRRHPRRNCGIVGFIARWFSITNSSAAMISRGIGYTHRDS